MTTRGFRWTIWSTNARHFTWPDMKALLLFLPGLSFFWHYILHTDWQEEARKEVLQLFGKHTPNPKGIAKLKTMSMIMYESLRLYPPVVLVIRRVVERKVKLGRLILPANLELAIPIVAFHYDSELWGQDVQLFKPERFAEGVVKATDENIAAFLPLEWDLGFVWA